MIRCLCLVLLCVFCVGSAPPVAAQEAATEPLEIGPSGEAYLRAIRFRGINPDVVYYDPTRPAPSLSTSEAPRARPEGAEPGIDADGAGGTLGAAYYIVLAIMVATLALILYLFVQFGGMGAISFGAAPDNSARRPGEGLDPGEDAPETPRNLAEILRLADRSAAIVALAHYVLNKVVASQGVLLQRSWTARDAMRRVPPGFDHREALVDLVLISERVQFGGRSISEEEFQRHVAETRPLHAALPPGGQR